jgi:hypothetical protein
MHRAVGYPLTEAGIAQAWVDLESAAAAPVHASYPQCSVVTTRHARVVLGMSGQQIHKARATAMEWPAGSGRYVSVWE